MDRSAALRDNRLWAKVDDLHRRLHTLEERSRHDRAKMRLLEKHLGIRLRDDLGEVQEADEDDR
jgi:hypothetical protein